MTVNRTPDGKWEVSDAGGRLAGPFDDSATAWRWIDRQAGEPINRSEKTSDWFWSKRVHGE